MGRWHFNVLRSYTITLFYKTIQGLPNLNMAAERILHRIRERSERKGSFQQKRDLLRVEMRVFNRSPGNNILIYNKSVLQRGGSPF